MRLWHGQCMQAHRGLYNQRRLWQWQYSGLQGQRGWRRPWLQGWTSLLRWVPLSVPTKAGAGEWGGGVAMSAPPLVHHSTMAPCFCGGLGFFHKLSQLWSSLILSLQAVSSQPTAVPSLGLLSKPCFPAPSLSLHQETHDSGLGVQACGKDRAHSSYFVLSSTD